MRARSRRERTGTPGFGGDGRGRSAEQRVRGRVQEAGAQGLAVHMGVAAVLVGEPRLQGLLALPAFVQQLLPKEGLLQRPITADQI